MKYGSQTDEEYSSCGPASDVKALDLTFWLQPEQVEYSVSFGRYVADVGFPGQVRCKFNTQVGMVVDFLKLNSIDGKSSWTLFPLSGNFQRLCSLVCG